MDQAMISIVSSSGLNMNIGSRNSERNLVLCIIEICWLLKSKKLGSIVPPIETQPWRHDVMQQTTELNIVATDDQKDHKVRKLIKEQLSQLN